MKPIHNRHANRDQEGSNHKVVVESNIADAKDATVKPAQMLANGVLLLPKDVANAAGTRLRATAIVDSRTRTPVVIRNIGCLDS